MDVGSHEQEDWLDGIELLMPGIGGLRIDTGGGKLE